MRHLKIFLALLTLTTPSFAALPFVTDDAGTANKNQLVLEEFTEQWHLPKKNEEKASNLIGQYAGLSYGLTERLELGVGGLAAYDFTNKSLAVMNPIVQLKSIIFKPKNPEVPAFALSAGYVTNNGQGQYYDNATNYYLIGIFTTHLFDDNLIMHVNTGPKASYGLPIGGNLHRIQLGVAIDAALFRKDIRLFAESYNGTPNSPRDSPGLFHSYQTGFKWIKSDSLAFNILYGSQPTFAGYDANQESLYRRTSTIQIGVRKVWDNFF